MLGATRIYSENGLKAAIGRILVDEWAVLREGCSPPDKRAPILKRGLPLNLASQMPSLSCVGCGGKERDRSQTVIL
jgi:hypothetical protein